MSGIRTALPALVAATLGNAEYLRNRANWIAQFVRPDQLKCHSIVVKCPRPPPCGGNEREMRPLPGASREIQPVASKPEACYCIRSSMSVNAALSLRAFLIS